MFQWFSTIRNKWGAPLANWQVEVRNPSDDSVVSIFSDISSTPIATVSGITNRAKSDDNGNYGFFVGNGTYDLVFYNASGVFQQRVEDVPMYGSEVTALPRGSVTDLAITFADDPDTGIYSPDPNSITIRTGDGGSPQIRLENGAGNGPNLVLDTTLGAVVNAGLTTGSATFAVESKVGGILFPRMTTTQRNAMISPADGLVIYNQTTSKLQVRAGGTWVDLH